MSEIRKDERECSILYIGRVPLQGGNVGHKFERLDEWSKRTGDTACFKVDRKKYAVGWIYKAKCVFSITTGEWESIKFPLRIDKQWQHDEYAMLRAEAAIFDEHERARALEKKHSGGDLLPKDFHELAEMHSRLRHSDKHAFEQLVTAKLRALSDEMRSLRARRNK